MPFGINFNQLQLAPGFLGIRPGLTDRLLDEQADARSTSTWNNQGAAPPQ